MINSKRSGVYTAPDKEFSIVVPEDWTLRQSHRNLEIASPSGKGALVVTTFRKTEPKTEADAREHLRRFLKGAGVKGTPRVLAEAKSHSSAEYLDSSDRAWRVAFYATSHCLVLATFNSDQDEDSDEKRRGLDALESIRI